MSEPPVAIANQAPTPAGTSPSSSSPAGASVPWRWLVLLYAVGLLVYGGVAAGRLRHPSSAPHFVLQADAWRQGKLTIDKPAGDDWAKVETVVLDDGRRVRGRRLMTKPVFRTTGGELLPVARVTQSLGSEYFMSFPPFPSVVMLPQTLLSGKGANDTVTTALLAALVLPLGFAMLRRLVAFGLSQRSVSDDVWLTATLAFGTVMFFAAVQGKVWFTAHVIGVVLALIYSLASLGANSPWTAGLALGCAAITRTPMAFMFPLFLFELWRTNGGLAAWRTNRPQLIAALRGPLLRFSLPVVAIAIVAGWYNVVRFGSFTEFGHSFLDVRQQLQIERWGLFDVQYLSRNLAVALALLPSLTDTAPYVTVGGHGLALWVTTPALLLLLWPRYATPMAHGVARGLWCTVALVAIPTLFYQNSGWWQFGYRFSLDYTVFLIALLAIGGRPLTRMVRACLVLGMVINLFGAVTFDRHYKYYRLGGNAYDVVISH